MANIALIGASGNVGSRLLKELSNRDQVTAIARSTEKIAALPGVTAATGDAQDADCVAERRRRQPQGCPRQTPARPAGLSRRLKEEATNGAETLAYLRDDLDWTFLSPSAMFVPGERTGKFRLGRDELLTSNVGSSISFEDYAIAMVDEIENPQHPRQRFTVGY